MPAPGATGMFREAARGAGAAEQPTTQAQWCPQRCAQWCLQRRAQWCRFSPFSSNWCLLLPDDVNNGEILNWDSKV